MSLVESIPFISQMTQSVYDVCNAYEGSPELKAAALTIVLRKLNPDTDLVNRLVDAVELEADMAQVRQRPSPTTNPKAQAAFQDGKTGLGAQFHDLVSRLGDGNVSVGDVQDLLAQDRERLDKLKEEQPLAYSKLMQAADTVTKLRDGLNKLKR